MISRRGFLAGLGAAAAPALPAAIARTFAIERADDSIEQSLGSRRCLNC